MAGLDFDQSTGQLYLTNLTLTTPGQIANPSALYSVNITTGAATLIGATGIPTIDGLAWKGVTPGITQQTFSSVHTYLDNGNYSITYTVTDDDGGVATSSVPVTVNNVIPVITALSVDSAVINENGSVTISGSLTDVGTLDTHTVLINWGNGETSSAALVVQGNGSGTFTATHQYKDDNPTATAVDAYTITATVTDDDGGSASSTIGITVNNVAPVITGLSVNSAVINENGSVTISGSLTDVGTLDTHTILINWGNGETSSAALVVQGNGSGTFSATHQYKDDNPTASLSDAYTITATVTDDDGGVSANSTIGVTVNNVAPVITGLSVNSAVINENGSVTINGNITDPGTLDTFTLTVNWGDGSLPQSFSYAAGTTSFSESHQYLDDNPTATSTDTYNIQVSFSDDDGGAVSGAASSANSFGWAVRAGSNDDDFAQSVATDAAGNVYVAGAFKGTVDFDPTANTANLTSAGNYDVFVAKYSPAGSLIWARRLGGSSNDQGFGVAVDGAGNIYTTGQFSGTADFDPGSGSFPLSSVGLNDVFVSKLNSNGDFVWAKQFGGTGEDWANGIAVDGAGNIYTTGLFSGTADFDPSINSLPLTSNGGNDAFVSKLNSNGDIVWAKKLGGSSSDLGTAITLDAAGNVYTTGGFVSSDADFDPGSESYVLASAGDFDVFISKLSNSGDFVWAKRFGGFGQDLARAIAVDGGGNVHTTGLFNSNVDFDPSGSNSFVLSNPASAGWPDAFVSKLDAAGNFVWAKQLGSSNTTSGDSSIGTGLALDGAGNVYTTGYFIGVSDFDPGAATYTLSSSSSDIYASRLDSSGNFVWAKRFGGAGSDSGFFGIALDSSANVYLAGKFSSVNADFDPGSGVAYLTTENATSGTSDMFLARLSSEVQPLTITVTVNNVAPQNVNAGSDQTVNEGSLVNLSGSFTDPGTADTHTQTWSVVASNNQTIANGSGSNFSFVPNDNGTYTITYTVTDDDNGSSSDSVVVTVSNVVPQNLYAGVDQTVNEGDTVNLSGSFTDPGSADTHTQTWSVVDSNGQTIANGSGSGFSFVPNDNGNYTITYMVTDDDGGSQYVSQSVTVENVAPQVSLSQPLDSYKGVQGQVRNFLLLGSDISSPDAQAGLNVQVDWGDGTSVLVTQLSLTSPSEALAHTYALAGTYQVTATAKDKDNGLTTFTQSLQILVAEQQGGELIIGGTSGNDQITINSLSDGRVEVLFNAAPIGLFDAPGQVRAMGYEGDDRFSINGSSRHLELNGGAGDDLFEINGSAAAVGVSGGNGTDTLSYSGSSTARAIAIVGETAEGWSGNETTTSTSFIGIDALLGSATASDILSSPNSANNWLLDSNTGGTFNGKLAFRSFESLRGGSASDRFEITSNIRFEGSIFGGDGDDAFAFDAGSSLSGTVAGDGGNDLLELLASARTMRVNATDAGGWNGNQVSGSLAFSGINSLRGSSASGDQLIGPDVVNSWSLTSATGGVLGSSLTFSGFEALVGGAEADTFALNSGATFLGSINGSGGADVMNLDAISIATRWLLTGLDAGSIVASSDSSTLVGAYLGIESLVGSQGEDTFVLPGNAGAGRLVTGSIDAQGGADAIDASIFPRALNWKLTGVGTGEIAEGSEPVANFTSALALTGGLGDDEFAISTSTIVVSAVDGGGGRNWLNYSAFVTSGAGINVTFSTRGTATATGVRTQVRNVLNVIGSQGDDVLVGNTALASTAAGHIFVGLGGADSITGGSGRDILIGGNGADTLRGLGGEDIIIGCYTTYDTNFVTLGTLMSLWSTTQTFAARKSALTTWLTVGRGGTVVDDKAADIIEGGLDQDWLFVTTKKPTNDTVLNSQASDDVTSVL